MSKLLTVAGAIITVALNQLANVIRDVMKNDPALRVYGVSHTVNSGGIMVDDGDIIDPVSGSNISFGYFAASPTAAADHTFTVVKQANGGYKVSDTGTAAVDTPEKMAALAYGDPLRTTFPSMAEFAILALESGIQSAYGGDLDCIVFDQLLEKTEGYVKNFDAGATGFTEMLVAEQDDISGNQYAE